MDWGISFQTTEPAIVGQPARPSFQNKIPDHERFVCFRHPAWPRGLDVFLFLETLDNLPGRGIHHHTAWLACAVIAGNAFNGYLSPSPDPNPVIAPPLGAEVLLKGSDYWFHVPDPNRKDDQQQAIGPATPYLYPICSDFRGWWFPHGRLNEIEWWMAPQNRTPKEAPTLHTSASEYVNARERTCRITNHHTGCHSVNVIPGSEAEWFTRNGMMRYACLPPHGTIHSASNQLWLRADLGMEFDKGSFVLLPKGINSGFRYHSLHDCDLAGLYHNVHLHPIPLVRSEYLLARFAWAFIRAQIVPSVDFPRKYWKMDVDGIIKVVTVGVVGGILNMGALPCEQLPPKRLRSVAPSPSPRPEKRRRVVGDSKSEGNVGGNRRLLGNILVQAINLLVEDYEDEDEDTSSSSESVESSYLPSSSSGSSYGPGASP